MTGRFDNPHLLTAAEACARLEVKRETLYSYVSRHRLRTVKVGRERRYDAEDIERLAVMSAARRGHAAVAGGALRWGEPVLDSALTAVVDGRLYYRGREVVPWLRAGARFEDVVAHLWGASPDDPWPSAPPHRRRAHTDSGWPASLARMARALLDQAERDAQPHGGSPSREHARGRGLIQALAATLGPGPRGDHLAAQVAHRLGDGDTTPLVEAALVLCADHELNVSTFAVRVAASAGADLYGAVGAGLFAFTGPKHGASTLRIDALVAQSKSRPDRAVASRLARGEDLPGFGHPLYPDGDPRTPPLLELARRFGGRRLRGIDRLIDAVERATDQRPNLDLGLLALCRAADWPAEIGSALFALGRSAGWVAHALEQRNSPALLRPRARYVGPPPTS